MRSLEVSRGWRQEIILEFPSVGNGRIRRVSKCKVTELKDKKVVFSGALIDLCGWFMVGQNPKTKGRQELWPSGLAVRLWDFISKSFYQKKGFQRRKVPRLLFRYPFLFPLLRLLLLCFLSTVTGLLSFNNTSMHLIYRKRIKETSSFGPVSDFIFSQFSRSFLPFSWFGSNILLLCQKSTKVKSPLLEGKRERERERTTGKGNLPIFSDELLRQSIYISLSVMFSVFLMKGVKEEKARRERYLSKFFDRFAWNNLATFNNLNTEKSEDNTDNSYILIYRLMSY